MLPYDVGPVAEARRAELVQASRAGALARQVRQARRARRAQRDVPGWRQEAGRVLVAFAVNVGVPRTRRDAVRRRAQDLLGAGRSC